MKGVVFTEFVELVEVAFSPDIADQIIDECDLESGGAYTSLGTYNHEELLSMVVQLSRVTDQSVAELVRTFGRHLADRFREQFPQFFDKPDLFSFLESIEGFIHVEVRKLYPDAELPSFETERPAENQLVMKYSSTRPFADLANGLIQRSIELFEAPAELTYQDTSNGTGTQAEFTITLDPRPVA